MGTFGGPADWWTDGTDAGRKHIATKGIVQDGLVLNLDAGVSDSYPGSGTTWTDLSGNGNNGALVNGVGYSSSDGGSLIYDGVNDYLSLPYSNLLDFGAELSLTGLIKIGNLNSNQYIFSSRDVQISTYTEGFLFFYISNSSYGLNSNILGFQFGQNNWAWNLFGSNGISITDTEYHFVAVTASSLNTTSPNIKFYIDDSNISGTRWTAGKTAAIRYASNINGIRIGSSYTPSSTSYSNNYSNMTLGKFSIYNKALSSEEILQNYNATRGRFGI